MPSVIEIENNRLGILLDTAKFNVVEAANPSNIANPLPLKWHEAESLCNDLIEDTCADWCVVEIHHD